MTPQSRNRLSLILVPAGLLLVMVASALPLLRMGAGWFGWLYAAGAALVLAGRVLTAVPKDTPLRLRRLIRMELWTALIFVAGAVFTLIPSGGNDWLAFTMAGGILTIYTSIMIPRERARKNPQT